MLLKGDSEKKISFHIHYKYLVFEEIGDIRRLVNLFTKFLQENL